MKVREEHGLRPEKVPTDHFAHTYQTYQTVIQVIEAIIPECGEDM